MLFSRRLFSQWMQLWHFKLVWMIAHRRFKGNLRLQVPGKVFGESGQSVNSNSWENLTHYYLLTCCIVVNVVVWEIGREKQAAGQSRALGRVMWTKCLPRDTIQPMEYTLRNSNEIICKHRKLPLQVPGKVFGESGQSVLKMPSDCIRYPSISFQSLNGSMLQGFGYFTFNIQNVWVFAYAYCAHYVYENCSRVRTAVV